MIFTKLLKNFENRMGGANDVLLLQRPEMGRPLE